MNQAQPLGLTGGVHGPPVLAGVQVEIFGTPKILPVHPQGGHIIAPPVEAQRVGQVQEEGGHGGEARADQEVDAECRHIE